MAIGAVSPAQLFPRLAAVIYQGGAGTTTTAARAGVPQIVVPHLLDQFSWARRVSLLDLGPPAIPRKRLTGQRLLDVLGMTLENETLSERVSWAPVCRRGGIQSVGWRSCSSTRRTTPPTDGDTLATLAPLGGRK